MKRRRQASAERAARRQLEERVEDWLAGLDVPPDEGLRVAARLFTDVGRAQPDTRGGRARPGGPPSPAFVRALEARLVRAQAARRPRSGSAAALAARWLRHVTLAAATAAALVVAPRLSSRPPSGVATAQAATETATPAAAPRRAPAGAAAPAVSAGTPTGERDVRATPGSTHSR